MSQQHTPPVKGQGFNPDGGGFAQILIGDKAYPVARIVQCVNAHDELVAAVKQAEKWIAIQMADNGWPAERIANPPEGSHLFNLRAAIAKTQGAAA